MHAPPPNKHHRRSRSSSSASSWLPDRGYINEKGKKEEEFERLKKEVEKMSTGERSRMQLSEISRGARKLTQMIRSLFKARNFDGRSKRIRDGFVRDASRVTANAEEELESETGRRIDRGVAQFGSRSWRSCCHEEEEVKKVIRESLLLSSFDDEKASSSRSLGSYLRIDEFSSSYREPEEAKRIKISLKNSRRPRSKTATPNLIARLMGLEELPAREPAADSAETKPKRCGNAPERVTLRSIIEREKAENDDGSGFSDAPANEHRCRRLETEFCSRVMEVTTTWGGGEKQDGLKEHMQSLKLEDEERLKEVTISKKKKKKKDQVELPSRMSRMHVSANCEQKLKRVDGRQSSDVLSSHHRSSRKVSASPLPQSMRSAATSTEPQRRPAKESANPAMTSSRQEEGTSPSSKKQDDDDDDYEEPVINISPAALADAAQQKQESSKSSDNEQSKKDKSLFEIMPKPNKAGASCCCSGKSIDDDISNAKRAAAAGEVNHLENLLFNCHSFLLHARELSIDDEPAIANNSDAEAKLYLSCAEELLLRKRQYDRKLLTHRPPSATRSSERELPIGDMVEYVCEGIRKLGDYRLGGGGDARDGLFVRLERDLECKGVALNAVWDEGWREGVRWEAAAEVVRRVERMVVTALVEEVAMQLMK